MTITTWSLTLVSKANILDTNIPSHWQRRTLLTFTQECKRSSQYWTAPNTLVDATTKIQLFFNVNSAKVHSCAGPTNASEHCWQDAFFVKTTSNLLFYIRKDTLNKCTQACLHTAVCILSQSRFTWFVIDLIFQSRDVSNTVFVTINTLSRCWWME